MAIFRSRDHGDIQRENHQNPLCPFLPISQGASYASAWRNVQWCLPLFQAHIAHITQIGVVFWLGFFPI